MNNRSVPRFNPAPEQVGMHEDDMTYKDKLDQKAYEARQPSEDKSEGPMQPIIEKVVEYVPAAAKILGDPKAEKDQAEKINEGTPGPPERPIHDDKIEEFLRGQHKSKNKDGILQ
ncbi:hypothetical protein ACHAQA_008282 [Verticillium albo-atrum]